LLALLLGTVIAIDGLRLTKPVLLPLIGGVFLAILARPLQLRVREALPRRLRWVGLGTAMLAIIIGVGAFAASLGLAGRAVADEFRARRPQIESQVERVRATAERFGVSLPQPLQRQSPGGTAASADTAGSTGRRTTSPATPNAQDESGGGESGTSGIATQALRTILAGLGGLVLALGFALLGLAEAGEVRRRIAHLERGGGALDAIDEAAQAFRRYVWVKSLTSAITGVATWLAAVAFGLPLAWVWGFLAFLLEYVPSVGSLIAVMPPTLMALAEGGPGRAAAVFLTVGAIQVVLGNVVDPRLEGRLMAISPFGVLLSIIFWGWLWGPVGALLAVPLTVAFVIACRHIPGAHGVATVVAGDGVPDGDSAGDDTTATPPARG
jgi:predicted PurR-regulated permease PerM